MLLILAGCVTVTVDFGAETAEPDLSVVPLTDERHRATAAGAVTVSLLRSDDAGDHSRVSWEDSTCDGPLGPIAVVATQEIDGAVTAVGQALLYPGDTEPFDVAQPFEMALAFTADAPVQIHAVVDRMGDGVLGRDDPRGLAGEPWALGDGDALTDLAIEIRALECGAPEVCETVSVAGTVIGALPLPVAVVAATEDAAVVSMTWVEPDLPAVCDDSAFSPDAAIPFEIELCADRPTRLHAGQDLDDDGLLTPLDAWSTGLSAVGAVGNPVAPDARALEALTLHIEALPGILPGPAAAVTLGGQVRLADGAFKILGDDAQVIVVARDSLPPQAEHDLADVEAAAFDLMIWSSDELSGRSAVDFALRLPTDSLAYLWAYADEDGDGLVNESGEPVASGGDDENGRIAIAGTTPAPRELLLAAGDV